MQSKTQQKSRERLEVVVMATAAAGPGGGGVTYVGDELARLHGDGLAGGRVDDGRHGGLGAVRYRRSLGRRL